MRRATEGSTGKEPAVICGRRWDAATERWAFNLSTRPYTAAGIYTVTAVAGDADYVLDPTCRNTFVRQ